MNKILVIEDEEPVLAGMSALLTAENFDVIGAENGKVGVELAIKNQPDLIICDVTMPELDGYGVLRELRQNPATAMIPFIFLTAKSTKSDLRQGMELGADDYLIKPFTRDELLGAIAARFKKQTVMFEHYSTELKDTEEKVNHLVYYNNLIDLPNRLSLQEQFHQVIARIDKLPSQSSISILSISLDRFSRVNDSLGYTLGDLLLKSVAERLTMCVSSGDFVAHLQADIFAILLITEDTKSDVGVVHDILNTISQPFMLEGHEVFITASIGISRYPSDGGDIDTLIKNASLATFGAKKQGGNTYQFYTSDMQADSVDQLALESSLRRALEREEFQVYYQPQVELKTGKIVGIEALIRWKHPELGLISPATFIPLAEETGLIMPIGEWVLKTACAQTKAWQTAGFSSLRVAVNLSCRQFNQANLGESIVEILNNTGLAPQFLELEITESVLTQNESAAIKTLNKLKLLGIEISIDDFGTGYSSLSYLKKFPFSTLKIDRSFIRNINTDARCKNITMAIIQMSQKLNLKVIAEGVEAAEEVCFLCQHDCDEVQGYLFCRPVPPEELEKLLLKGKKLSIPILI
ncbi:EAL domain-containing protein [Cyanobacteria bacterium FACHB-472]|nr:EAL domain-containing protein [Cyanobacteria bacterium FACHB-472]